MTTEAIEAGGCAQPVHVPKPRRMLQPPKDELRRQLEVANATAAHCKGLLDDAIAKIDRDVQHALVIGGAIGAGIGVLLGWWAK